MNEGGDVPLIRLAALFSHPIQYFAPLFRALAAHPDIDLTVYFCSRMGVEETLDPGFRRVFRWDIPLLEGYNHKFLPNLRRSQQVRGFFSLCNPTIAKELSRKRYDALWIHGYAHATHWLAFVSAKITKIPILLRGESHLVTPRPFYIRLAKAAILRPLLRTVSACLYIGTHNRMFYEYYGVSRERLFFAPYTVDNSYFRQWAKRLAPYRDEIRARWGIHDKRPVILYVGKLVPWKQPLALLEAYRLVRQQYPCALLYAGDGALRTVIEEKVHEANIPDVVITGFLNQSEISQAYTVADILVLYSSHEPWGLVVNEGMNFELPVIVSNRVGCAPDLVRHGENGYIVPYDNVEALAEALLSLVRDPQQRIEMGRRSLNLIENWDIPQTVEGIITAAKSVC